MRDELEESKGKCVFSDGPDGDLCGKPCRLNVDDYSDSRYVEMCKTGEGLGFVCDKHAETLEKSTK